MFHGLQGLRIVLSVKFSFKPQQLEVVRMTKTKHVCNSIIDLNID